MSNKIVPVTVDLMALPACITESVACVLAAHGFTLCNGARPLSPDEVERVLKEIGRNGAQACMSAELVP